MTIFVSYYNLDLSFMRDPKPARKPKPAKRKRKKRARRRG